MGGGRWRDAREGRAGPGSGVSTCDCAESVCRRQRGRVAAVHAYVQEKEYRSRDIGWAAGGSGIPGSPWVSAHGWLPSSFSPSLLPGASERLPAAVGGGGSPACCDQVVWLGRPAAALCARRAEPLTQAGPAQPRCSSSSSRVRCCARPRPLPSPPPEVQPARLAGRRVREGVCACVPQAKKRRTSARSLAAAGGGVGGRRRFLLLLPSACCHPAGSPERGGARSGRHGRSSSSRTAERRRARRRRRWPAATAAGAAAR